MMREQDRMAETSVPVYACISPSRANMITATPPIAYSEFYLVTRTNPGQ